MMLNLGMTLTADRSCTGVDVLVVDGKATLLSVM